MTVDLEARAILSEYTSTNPVSGVSGGPNLASGTVRQMIAAALSLPEGRFRACVISLPQGGRPIRPDLILEVAQANDIDADDSRIGVT